MAEQAKLQAGVKVPANKSEDPNSSTGVVEEGNTMDEAEESPSAAEDDKKLSKQEELDDEDEEALGIKFETAPADIRFPTANQTHHCHTRYVKYHRCIAVKGRDDPECQKFAKYYRSLCPGEWGERWNEQLANGVFPGPL